MFTDTATVRSLKIKAINTLMIIVRKTVLYLLIEQTRASTDFEFPIRHKIEAT